MQIKTGSPAAQRGNGARALQTGKYGTSPLVFGKNIAIKEESKEAGDGSVEPTAVPSGFIDGKSPEKMTGLRLKIVKCEDGDGTEPAAQEQND